MQLSSAYMCTAFACMLVNPFDVIKTRKQVTPLDKSSMVSFAKMIGAKEGYWTGLWKPGFWA